MAKQGFFQPRFFPIDKNDCTCTTGRNCLAELAGVWMKVGKVVEDGATDDDDDTETSTTTVPNTCSNSNSNQNSADEIQSTDLDCNLDDDDDLPNPICAVYCNRPATTTTTAGPVDLTTTTTTVDQQNEAATTSTLESGELSSTSNNETHTGDGNIITNIRDIFDDETSSDEESAARTPSQHQQSRNK